MFDYLKLLIQYLRLWILWHLNDVDKVTATIGGITGYFCGLMLPWEFFFKFGTTVILAGAGAASGVAGKKGMTYFFEWWGKRKTRKKKP